MKFPAYWLQRTICWVIFAVPLSFMANVQIARASAEFYWVPLAEDGIHDPTGPAINELQEPQVVLSQLPDRGSQGVGNQVRWVDALESGAIKPRRSRLLPEPDVPVLDMDVLLDLGGSMRIVRFPHKAHTEWLGCNNCHDEIFKPKIGSNPIQMYQILNGEQCGRCHGAVSFPVWQCKFCHSLKHPGEVEQNGDLRPDR
ncbi:MAG: c(7)-type cytochrome triheme domain-containing protein [Gallionellaceae bacterium]